MNDIGPAWVAGAQQQMRRVTVVLDAACNVAHVRINVELAEQGRRNAQQRNEQWQTPDRPARTALTVR